MSGLTKHALREEKHECSRTKETDRNYGCMRGLTKHTLSTILQNILKPCLLTCMKSPCLLTCMKSSCLLRTQVGTAIL